MLSRQREAQSTVLYPAEVLDDKEITSAGIPFKSRGDSVSFLRGLNFCTDLYRLSENLDNMTRSRNQVSIEEPGGSVTAFLCRNPAHLASDSLHLISKLQKDLPQKLKTIQPVTGDLESDRYGVVGE